ncbi:MAG: radical SAM protein [Bdellovibrionota bacterium]
MLKLVNSKRFGSCVRVSLLTAGNKICGWRCIYCPVWPEEKSSIKKISERSKIIDTLNSILLRKSAIDSVVIGGPPEPTLHPQFHGIMQDIQTLKKELSASWQIHCVTNATELDSTDIQRGCQCADQVWVKLDCAYEDLFSETNQPKDSLKNHLKRIRNLAEPGIETVLWRVPGDPSKQNWTAENLRALLDIYSTLKVKKIHLTTPKKPSVFSKVQPVGYVDIEAFALRAEELGLSVTS